MDLREGMEMVGMGMLLCLLGPTPASLKSFDIRSAGSKTEELLLHSLHPNRDLESLARDVDEIGYPRLNLSTTSITFNIAISFWIWLS